jgi:hypothetical protein
MHPKSSLIRRFCTLSQEPRPMPIVRKLLLAAVASFTLAAAVQAPNPAPIFDVASVKRNKTEGTQHSNVPLDTGNVYTTIDPSDAGTPAGGYFVATNQPLWRYIRLRIQGVLH